MTPRNAAIFAALALLSPIIVAVLLTWTLLGWLLAGPTHILAAFFAAASLAIGVALPSDSGQNLSKFITADLQSPWRDESIDLVLVSAISPVLLAFIPRCIPYRVERAAVGAVALAAIAYAIAKIAVGNGAYGTWRALLFATCIVGTVSVAASVTRLWVAASLEKMLAAEDAVLALGHDDRMVEQPEAVDEALASASAAAKTPRPPRGPQLGSGDSTPLAGPPRLFDPRSIAALRRDSLARIVRSRPLLEDRGWYRRYRCAGVGTLEIFHRPPGGAAAPPARAPALVLVHGYASGNALWATVLRDLAARFHVFAVDWKGCGASHRPRWTARTPEAAETWLAEALEEWREAVGLESFVLCGHSMGGIVSLTYAETWPSRVSHLVLASPAAMVLPPEDRPLVRRPIFRLIRWLWERNVTPMRIARWMGPLGRWFLSAAIARRLRWMEQPDPSLAAGPELVGEYLYHNWALPGSGEFALNALLAPGAWARRPLSPRFDPALPMPITFIYGGKGDWMNSGHGKRVVAGLRARGKEDVECLIVPRAGHQLILENPKGFVSRFFARTLPQEARL